MNRRLAFLLAIAALLAGCWTPKPAPESEPGPAPGGSGGALTVAAASDLQLAFAELGQRYEEQTGRKVTFTYGASGNLTKQIENGAPIDLFAAADVAYIDQLREQGLIIPETQAVYAVGHLVLARNKAAGVTVESLEDLLDPAVKHVAIANPDHAPYGRAAREALVAAGLWDKLQPKLVLGENIRQTLQFIQTGNAEAGLVALSIAGVPEIDHLPVDESLYSPLNQGLGVVKGSQNERAAREFAAMVLGAEGRQVLERYGFQVPEG